MHYLIVIHHKISKECARYRLLIRVEIICYLLLHTLFTFYAQDNANTEYPPDLLTLSEYIQGNSLQRSSVLHLISNLIIIFTVLISLLHSIQSINIGLLALRHQ